ncbi:MAG: hypothetical protein MI922_29110 [Bacteroidales bacterium]|nr:hypothetical protein [Bacteroidales bacterium]
MKRKVVIFIAALIISCGWISKGYGQEMEVGDIHVNVGLGLISNINLEYSSQQIPPVFVKFDYILRNDIGPGIIAIGGHLSFDSYKYTRNYTDNNTVYEYGWKQSRAIIGLTGKYYYHLVDNLDAYGKIMIGYSIMNPQKTGYWPNDYVFTPKSNSLTFGLGAGIRYSITNNLGVFAELGYDAAFFMAGVNLSLK